MNIRIRRIRRRIWYSISTNKGEEEAVGDISRLVNSVHDWDNNTGDSMNRNNKDLC